MARPLPTTKAQVSGHKFLRRRVEHGLVLGDTRMIHDPLARRRKAMMFGGVGVAFLAVGSGLLAWLQPSPQPGDAPIVRSEQGQLFVDVNDTYHPVYNLASARIIAGKAADARTIGSEHLRKASLGTPVGISDAPGYLAAPGETPQRSWAACLAGRDEQPADNPTSIDGQQVAKEEVIVVADPPQKGFGEKRAALAETDGTQWLLTAEGRVRLPDAQSREGRVIRRGIGIGGSTHVWPVPAELLNAFAEQPPLTFPDTLPDIMDTGQVQWARTDGGVAELTATQADMLVSFGARRLAAAPHEVGALADAPLKFHLPTTTFEFVGPDKGWMCADSAGGGAMVSENPGTVALAGEGIADRFGGLSAGGVGVDTGHGYHVVSSTGQRHAVDNRELLEALGTGIGAEVPWEIIRLLPEASRLNRDEALRVGP